MPRLQAQGQARQTHLMIRDAYGRRQDEASPAARARVPMLWAGGGFVAGVCFWHLVGFWSVVGSVVLGGASPPGAEAFPTASRPPAGASLIETGSVRPRTPPCIALALIRSRGETQPVPCPAVSFHHLDGGVGSKKDMETQAAGWSVPLR